MAVKKSLVCFPAFCKAKQLANRHCPKCQSLAKAQWLEDRQQELLPAPYFHNVFTRPHEPAEPKTLADWILLWTGEDVTRCPQCGCTGLVTEEIPRPRCDTLPAANPDDFW